ncbi:DUF1877 family protein [Paucibacter sp. APW11]|uniref:DUF1877 family protein n=1 Tax=Roseateles aquae TaxID=3077235 RepID=A0ABU3PFN6_9BURK|nr:DUF1877 family protein [Paucibacter sp. APW11]MDT9001374.1 DUF1877 family protein [Paucibacter sp. APW11]
MWRVLEADDDSAYLQQLAEDNKTSLLQRLIGKKKAPAVPKSLAFSEAELKVLDLDKSWDGLRHCVKLCAPDAPDFFEGEGQIGAIEVGYGPALFTESHTLVRYSQALEGVSEEALLEKLRASDFEGIYLDGLWKRQDDDARSYLLENFRDLRAFTAHCASHGQAAILQYT